MIRVLTGARLVMHSFTSASEHVKEYLAGERRTAPRVRWLTRGHGKMQTHGPRGSLRKPIRIAPYWNPKDPEFPIADRAHRLKKKG